MTEENKKKQDINKPVDNSAEGTADASQQYIDTMVRTAQASADATAKYNNDVAKANGAYQDVVGQILDYGAKIKEEEANAKIQNSLDAQKAAFGGVSQVVSALFAQNGVNKGASPMQVRDYASDWMAEADKKRNERKVYLDNIKDKQRQAQMQIEQMRNANTIAEAKGRYDTTMAQLGAEQTKAQTEYQVAQAEQSNKTALAKIQSDYNIKVMDNNTKLAIANMNNSREMLKLGYMLIDNGYVYNEDLARQNGKGSGSSNTIAVTLAEYEGMPQETINIKPNSLENTVKMNIFAGVIDDLSEQDQKALINLTNTNYSSMNTTDRMNAIMGYVVKSPKLRELVKASAEGDSKSAPAPANNNEQDADAAELDENGFPTV